MAHDDDLDVSMFLKDYTDDIPRRMFEVGFTYKLGRILYKDDGSMLSRVDHYRWKGLQLDVLYWTEAGDRYDYIAPVKKPRYYSYRRPTGIEYIQYNGEAYPVPAPPDKWLADSYGESWRTPMLVGWRGSMTPGSYEVPELNGKVLYSKSPFGLEGQK
jgi:hypothetical protein